MRHGQPVTVCHRHGVRFHVVLSFHAIFIERVANAKCMRVLVPLSDFYALPIGDLECHALRYCLPLTIYNFVGVRYCNLDAFGNAFIACIANGKWLLICVQLLVLLTVALCDEQRLRNGNIFGQPNVVAECVTHAQWMLICVPLFVCFALALRDG